MRYKYRYPLGGDNDLDVSSFMNLMIVLVPVLLLSMTFTQVTVMDIKLPELTGGDFNSDSSQSQLDVVVSDQGFKVFYPSDVLIQEIPLVKKTLKDGSSQQVYNFPKLLAVMREAKTQLPDKRDITLLLEPGIEYQALISTIQNVKSYQTVIAGSLVEIELFPEVSLGDTP